MNNDLYYCGSCAYFDYEDIYGYGYCRLQHREQYCGDRCNCNKYKE